MLHLFSCRVGDKGLDSSLYKWLHSFSRTIWECLLSRALVFCFVLFFWHLCQNQEVYFLPVILSYGHTACLYAWLPWFCDLKYTLWFFFCFVFLFLLIILLDLLNYSQKYKTAPKVMLENRRPQIAKILKQGVQW